MAEAQEAGRAGMYALWVSIMAGTENRSLLERLAALAVEGLGIDQGLKGITFVFDESAGEYGGESIGEYCAFSLWASKEDAEAAAAALDNQLGLGVSGFAVGPPNIRVFEVYEPKVSG